MHLVRDVIALLVCLIFCLAGCQGGDGGSNGGNNNATPTQNPIPTLSSMTPTAIVTHMPDFSLEVTGSDFVNGAKVVFNNTEMDTTFVSATKLTCKVSSAATVMALAGEENLYVPQKETVTVLVRNPSPGGGDSGSMDFTLHDNFTFTIPKALTQSGTDTYHHDAHASQDGVLDVVWRDSDHPLSMRHSNDGGNSWSAVRTVSTGDCNRPSITRDSEGTLHCAYDRNNSICFASSTNNGQAWSEKTIAADDPSDIELIAGNNQDLYLFTITQARVRLFKSADYGASWNSPVQISPSQYAYRLHADIDDDGALVVTWNHSVKMHSNDGSISFSRSTDGGVTWLTPKLIATGPSDVYSVGGITVAQNQRLFLTWSTYSRWFGGYSFDHWVQMRWANKLGNTWSSIIHIQPEGKYGTDSFIHTDGVNNLNHFMTNSNNVYPNCSPRLLYQRSTDNGDSWSEPVLVKNLFNNSINACHPVSSSDASGYPYVFFIEKQNGHRVLFMSRGKIPN